MSTLRNISPLSCGVAICTCNGGSFLEGQLRSLLEQTRKPDRIVVSDDRSDDGSWDRLVRWAEHARNDFGICVTLIRNETRLGVSANFQQAIAVLDTDIIFLCDQDDVWNPGKIEVLAGHIELHPDVLLAHSDAYLIDEKGDDLGISLFNALRMSSREKWLIEQGQFFEVYCRRNLVTGMATAFRRQLLQCALPIPDDWIHDEWLAVCAAANGSVAMLPNKLCEYRQHGANVIGMPVTTVARLATNLRRLQARPRKDYLNYKYRRLEALRRRLLEMECVTTEKIKLVEEAQRHFRRRLRFSARFLARVLPVIQEMRRRGYHRFADGLAGLIRDLLRI